MDCAVHSLHPWGSDLKKRSNLRLTFMGFPVLHNHVASVENRLSEYFKNQEMELAIQGFCTADAH